MTMLFALIGSSGSGKTTVGETLFGKEREIVSFTTRPQRVNEVDGIDYHFMSLEGFNDALGNNQLIEYSKYSDNYYGITKSELDSKLAMGNSYVVIDYNGYSQIKNLIPNDVLGIFVDVNRDTVKERLLERNETEDFIAKRMSLFDEEQLLKDKVDYILDNNGSLASTIENFRVIIRPLLLKDLEKALD